MRVDAGFMEQHACESSQE